MNAQIIRVFGVIVILFTLLIVWTTRWTVIVSCTALSRLNASGRSGSGQDL